MQGGSEDRAPVKLDGTMSSVRVCVVQVGSERTGHQSKLDGTSK